jgi:serine/threonine-protein kinase
VTKSSFASSHSETALAETALAETVLGSDGPECAPAPEASTAEASETVTVSSLQGESASAEQRAFANQEEHVAAVIRLRYSLGLGIVLYSVFGVADWIVSAYIEPGVFWRFMAIRAVFLAVSIWPILRLFRRPLPSPALLRFIDLWVLGLAALSIGIMCISFGGLQSPYFIGILMALVIRATALPEHWKRGLIPICLIGVMPTLVMVPAALFSPFIAAQWQEPSSVATFVLIQGFFFGGTMGFVALGGHTVWSIRRQLFETRNIGRYRLKSRIGSGGMGEVWRAYHTTLKRDIALKIIRPKQSGFGEAVDRFEREVRATSLLSHPNTIRVFDFGGTDDGLFYYAMELLEGRDLREVVEREGPMPPGRAVAIALQATRALSEAHQRGIVHRDVKPRNLFLVPLPDEPDFVKVLDFGIARVGGAIGEPTITKTGWMGGTPAFLSPEVARGERGDSRIDLYGLGGVLYFLLTGGAPFLHDNHAALIYAHLFEEPTAPSKRSPHSVPEVLDVLVLKCLAKDPEERHQTAADLACDLAGLLRALPSTT